ncbi:MAG: M81 family metallopeptidase [Bdellovibrionales bacterium]|nr:M81 family metallopeptidase [Ramlibacter sp.]
MTVCTTPRVALLGLLLESNRFAPVTTQDDFLNWVYLAGDEILRELDRTESRLPPEVRGFRNALDARGTWEPVPILIGQCESGGPMEHAFFERTLADMRQRLIAALPLDGVYIANHGAMTTTACRDPDGAIFAMVRDVVGAQVPVVATLDLHGNVSQQMVDEVDAIVAYRTNPHVDMMERGAEAALILGELWGGMQAHTCLVRLPIAPPTVTLLTESGPYADLINYGQSQCKAGIVNVSVLGGFAFADTEKNGLAIIVTSRGSAADAQQLAYDMARRAWADHPRYRPQLMPLDTAVQRVRQVCRDPSLAPLILADVADNPGGGGRGNTTWILQALLAAQVQGVLMGIFNEPSLAAQAHRLGEGGQFIAEFNTEEPGAGGGRLKVRARVLRLRDGDCGGRRGLYAGRSMSLGPSALLDLGGIHLVVVSVRTQCADPVFFEMFGEDIARARAVVVKSRGHFRAGFNEYFSDAQVLEVDAPGLTSPVLSRFEFLHLPRPIFPVDTQVQWPG